MIPAEKQMLRARMKAAVAALPEKSSASVRLRNHLWALPQWKCAGVIYGFAPLRSEPNWLEGFDGKKLLAFPRVSGTDMSFWTADALVAGALGIREPRGGCPAPPPDLILVPGLGFDREGRRLGRGGGFYDRWLERAPAVPRIGVCFGCQLVEHLPSEAHDCLVDGVVTEEGFFPASRPGCPSGS